MGPSLTVSRGYTYARGHPRVGASSSYAPADVDVLHRSIHIFSQSAFVVVVHHQHLPRRRCRPVTVEPHSCGFPIYICTRIYGYMLCLNSYMSFHSLDVPQGSSSTDNTHVVYHWTEVRFTSKNKGPEISRGNSFPFHQLAVNLRH